MSWALAFGSWAMILRIWYFDVCMLERVLFDARIGRWLKSYGFTATWGASSDTLAWYLTIAGKRRGWMLRAPILKYPAS